MHKYCGELAIQPQAPSVFPRRTGLEERAAAGGHHLPAEGRRSSTADHRARGARTSEPDAAPLSTRAGAFHDPGSVGASCWGAACGQQCGSWRRSVLAVQLPPNEAANRVPDGLARSRRITSGCAYLEPVASLRWPAGGWIPVHARQPEPEVLWSGGREAGPEAQSDVDDLGAPLRREPLSC